MARLAAPNPVIGPAISGTWVLAILAALRSDVGCLLIDPNWPGPQRQERVEGAGVPVGTTLFTSGSSGIPKAVSLSEANWQAAAASSSEFFDFGPGRSWLLALPLYHVSGLSIIFRSLWSGGSVLISPDLSRLADADLASLVSTQLLRVLSQSPGNLRSVLVGGGRVPTERLQAHSWPLVQTYGMTETAAAVASAPPDNGLGPMFPLPGVELATSSDGRLRIRSDQIAASVRGEDGWLQTNDFGTVASDGSVSVTGRADRMITSGGEKIDPDAIAEVLAAVPEIGEVAVLGVPDPDWDEAVGVAYTGSAPPGVMARAVIDAFGSRWQPRRFLQVDGIPRTSLGKPDYPTLRSQFS